MQKDKPSFLFKLLNTAFKVLSAIGTVLRVYEFFKDLS